MSDPRVLVVGSGGREHALVQALHDSDHHPEMFVAPGNPGMARIADRVPLGATDVEGITGWARAHEIDLVVIGPDAAIAAGLGDALRLAGIDALGPDQEAARLEWSKRHAKETLRRLGLPTAPFRVATTAEEAERMAEEAAYPLVLKADGLAAGKGVVIAQDPAEARATIDAWMRAGHLGDAGRSLVLEDHLKGEEASILVLTDGTSWMLFPPARDHKRVGEGDTGPNTGGMGAFAPARVPAAEEALSLARRIADPLLADARARGVPYRGILYLGLMLTPSGPMVLEINARFGDPEAQVVLPILDEDPYPLLLGAARGSLPAERHGTFLRHAGAAVCVVLTARGYPGAPETGAPIDGLDGPWPHGVRLYHAGVGREGDQWVVAGGRVVGVTARADTLERARDAAYGAAARIHFDGVHLRRDIAAATQPWGATVHEF